MSEPGAFEGWIASAGSSSGVRVVVGSWDTGPFGRVDDVLVETSRGRRVLLAPTAALADEIGQRYSVDDVVLGPVQVRRGRQWSVTAPGLDLTLVPGRRSWLGGGVAAGPGRRPRP